MKSLILLFIINIFVINIFASIVGRKRFLLNSNGEIKQTLYFILNEKIDNNSTFFMEYDDTNKLNYESVRSIYFKSNNITIGDQSFISSNIFSPEFKKIRGISLNTNLFSKYHNNTFFTVTQRHTRIESFFGKNKKGPYFLNNNIITETVTIYCNDELLYKNIDYILDYSSGILYFNQIISENDLIKVKYTILLPGKKQNIFSTEFNFNNINTMIISNSYESNETKIISINGTLNIKKLKKFKYNLAIGDNKHTKDIATFLLFEKTKKYFDITGKIYNISKDFPLIQDRTEYQGQEINFKGKKKFKGLNINIKNYKSFKISNIVKSGLKEINMKYVLKNMEIFSSLKNKTKLFKLKLFDSMNFPYFYTFLGENYNGNYYFCNLKKQLNYKKNKLFTEISKFSFNNKRGITIMGNSHTNITQSLSFKNRMDYNNITNNKNLIYDSYFEKTFKNFYTFSGYHYNKEFKQTSGLISGMGIKYKRFSLNIKEISGKINSRILRTSGNIKNIKWFIENRSTYNENNTKLNLGFNHNNYKLDINYELSPLINSKKGSINLSGILEDNWNFTININSTKRLSNYENKAEFLFEYKFL